MTLNPVTPEFESELRAQLPGPCFGEVTPGYLEEPRGRWQGQAGLLLRPGTTDEVATVVRKAHEARVPLVPYGGGTGLVGGQIAMEGPAPVLLSLERMRAVRGIWPEENVMVVEAGAILSDIHDAASGVDRLFPLTIAAKGSAQIGGNLATNAGGVNVLRYGNARDLCLGVEAVLPNGDIFHGLKRLRKDNSGYDLRNLLIGSEGSLGVITAAALKLYPRPALEGTALMVVPGPEAALSLLALGRDHLGEGISAFELMHRTGLEFLNETMPDVRLPFADLPDWFVLIDIGLARGLDPAGALEALFAEALDKGLASDGLIAQSDAQRQAFWAVRESIPEANRRIGSVSSHDISVPLSVVPDFIARGNEAIAALEPYRVNCFGHLGDGNLHYNVFPPMGEMRGAYVAQRDVVKRTVHDLVHQMGGSVSAEHGVGRLKVEDLERYGDPAKLSAMRAIKAALDPRGIMNPGVILRG
ncbi:FAD-binding oxidoreductase [Roseovarius rhodophyticola]|uniref:FAD-binding oxidoreductase n=1 Tax=Roseovarius rhodophyticola TaxID=3080827 RepID=A0ABZ2TBH9_9RHOB|nr:FAD-binding oxidoreductase [Roseovarius sp. W115]MDV2930775.1 FAD-binding oxidoreductase [Roseovarius sp. W115]